MLSEARRRAAVMTGSLALLVAVGCRTDLRPAPGARTVPGLEQAAVGEVDGVRVIAQVEEWPGPLPVQRALTPVRVVIENQGDAPLRMRYGDFRLVGASGRSYAALPPFEIEGDLTVRTGHPSISRPLFGFSGFWLAPTYRSVYPNLPVYEEEFGYDRLYYDAYEAVWEAGLPTREMIDHALPEGVLDADGRIDGFLYFEKVPERERRIVFRADLVDARTGRVFGEARMPFIFE